MHMSKERMRMDVRCRGGVEKGLNGIKSQESDFAIYPMGLGKQVGVNPIKFRG